MSLAASILPFVFEGIFFFLLQEGLLPDMQRIRANISQLVEWLHRPLIGLNYRKQTAVFLLFMVPIFLGIGFAVQAIDVIDDSPNAILWFAVSATLAAILILVWEEIAVESRRGKIIVGTILELFVLNLFYQGASWAARKAVDASHQKIEEIAERSRADNLYRQWLNSHKAQPPIEIASKFSGLPLPAKPKPIVQAKPTAELKFVYPDSPDVVIVNNSAMVARAIKWEVALWNMDRIEDPNPLPIPVQTFDFVKPHDESGAEEIFDRVASLLHKGDRLFGTAVVDCPECESGKSYVVYIVWGTGGWYSEVNGGGKLIIPVPPNTSIERSAYFSSLEHLVPIDKRTPIAIPQFNGIPKS